MIYNFLDIETTGGSFTKNRIIEVAAIKFDGEKVLGTYETLINPEEALDWFIIRLTGIYPEMLTDAPKFHKIADELHSFLDDGTLVAHNAQFDYGFLKKEYSGVGKNLALQNLCTVKLSRMLYPKQPKHNLDAVMHAHGISITSDERHRAMGDTKAVLEFFQKARSSVGLDQFHKAVERLTKKH